MDGQCGKVDEDQAGLNVGVRNSQADRDNAIVGKVTVENFVGRPAQVSG